MMALLAAAVVVAAAATARPAVPVPPEQIHVAFAGQDADGNSNGVVHESHNLHRHTQPTRWVSCRSRVLTDARVRLCRCVAVSL